MIIADFVNSFLNFISDNLLTIQIVSFLLSTAFLILTIYFISQTEFIREPFEHFFDTLGAINLSKRRTLRAWNQIQKRLKSGKVNDLKLAVLEADKVLDVILRMAGYPGASLDEHLEKMDAVQLSNIEEIRQAHKFRDRIANEPGLVISLNEAKIAVDIYRKAFQELNLIE